MATHTHDHTHDHAHAAHGHAANGHAAHGHAAHGHPSPADVAGDKRAAFVGLVGGMALIGALLYGMVLWTNAQFAGHGAAGGNAAAATH